jgi:hypothetical protein
MIPVIVKVRRPDYVPPGFELHTRIDATLFTARADRQALDAADADPEVVSIAPSRPLHAP